MKIERGALNVGENHPMVYVALKYIREHGGDLFLLLESMSSCAIEGNKTAEICAETLNKLINEEPVGERYVMGLAWFIYQMNQEEEK